jgi:hypothetical protein
MYFDRSMRSNVVHLFTWFRKDRWQATGIDMIMIAKNLIPTIDHRGILLTYRLNWLVFLLTYQSQIKSLEK